MGMPAAGMSKNPHAVELGRLGGRKGAEARSEIARIAANASWGASARAKRAANGRRKGAGRPRKHIAEQQK